MHGKQRIAAAAVVLSGLLGACADDQPALDVYELRGGAMGTTWSIKVTAPDDGVDMDALRDAAEAALNGVDAMMSTYRDDSDLSRFNASTSTEWVEVPAALCDAIAAALEFSDVSDGAFDPTVGALVNLWGFGPAPEPEAIPSPQSIADALAQAGYRKLSSDCTRPAIRKELAGLYVDLSAFAKGYAVDRVADELDDAGVHDYLVEIGGELRMAGKNGAGEDWAIAVERPVRENRDIQRVFRLTDTGMATSGDYRNFIEVGGERYSHTIDPRTGRPVQHSLASVTVLAELAAAADALATALLVLGPDDGMAFAERQQVAAYFLLRDGAAVEERSTAAFDRMTGQ